MTKIAILYCEKIETTAVWRVPKDPKVWKSLGLLAVANVLGW